MNKKCYIIVLKDSNYNGAAEGVLGKIEKHIGRLVVVRLLYDPIKDERWYKFRDTRLLAEGQYRKPTELELVHFAIFEL